MDRERGEEKERFEADKQSRHQEEDGEESHKGKEEISLKRSK